jgi:malate dehydrogenase
MVEASVSDRHLVLPGSAYLQGEYGQTGLFIGVPVQLGRSGVEKIIEYDLNERELQALEKPAAHVREMIEALAL